MSLCVSAFADEEPPARRLSDALGASFAQIDLHRFPDGESLPRVAAPAAGTTVLYRSLDHPNPKLIEILLVADALRRAGARRLILVAPYFCYLRQDAVFGPGEPLSRDVIGPLIGRAFDNVVTVQAHLHRTRDLSAVLGTPAHNLLAMSPLVSALPLYDTAPVVIGPDAEAAPWVHAWADRLGGGVVCLQKTRRGDRDVSVSGLSTDLKGRAAVVIDDVASSGRTLERAVEAAKSAGAASVDVAVVHALMDADATERIRRAGARRIVSTDSVRHPTNAATLAPMLAGAIREILR